MLKKEHIDFARRIDGKGGHDFSEKELRSLEIAILSDIADSLEIIAGKYLKESYDSGYEVGKIDGYDELERESD